MRRFRWLLCVLVAIALGAGWLVMLVPPISVRMIEAACGNPCTPDAINIAAQIGRLDLVSLALALLGIGVGAFALFGFFAIREDARAAAESVVPELVHAEVERQLKALRPTIVEELREKAETASVDEAVSGEPDADRQEITK